MCAASSSESDDDIVEHNSFKVVLLGAEAVGKTALVRRLVHNLFEASYNATVGADVYKAELQITPAVHATLQVWDIGSHVSSLDMAANYLHGCDAVLAVYDIGQPQSRIAACHWLDVLCQMFQGTAMPYVAVVANKADNDSLKAQAAELQADLALDISCYSYSVSAESASDVRGLFLSVAADLAGIPLPLQPQQLRSELCSASSQGRGSLPSSRQPHVAIQATPAGMDHPQGPEAAARSCCSLECREGVAAVNCQCCCCWFGWPTASRR